jgi:proline-rich AKT1 substrate 1
MLSCHCLNVIVETEGDLQKVTAGTLGLSREELQDSFFEQDVQQVGKLVNINKSHSGLIQTRNVGSWVIHYCINCDVHSHAVHREKGASCVLVNSKLFTKETIDKLRSSNHFSKLYNIVVNSDLVLENDTTANSYIPSDLEYTIRGLKQVAADVLKKETEEVDRRIRAFTDEQYNRLSELRDRAFREQQILTKIILKNNTLDKSKPSSTNSGMSNPQGMPSRLNEPLEAGSVKLASSPNASSFIVAKHTPKRQKSLPAGRMTSIDTEALFEFDGIDDIHPDTGSEVDESDVDDGRDDGVKIPKRADSSGATMAKSLPMTIPAFLSHSRNRSFEDVDDAPPIERNTDIAASIKALAKSVHGDTVFGDLPKPRYTYI